MSDDEDLLSLDFTMPGALEAPPAPSAVPAPAPTEPVGKPAARQELSLEPLELPAAKPAEPSPQSSPELSLEPLAGTVPTAAPPPAVAPPPAARPELPAALKEAAQMHAAGQDLDALRRLEGALKSNEVSGRYVQQVWASLFELLQVIGRRAAFDSLGLAYAKRFEKSPPTWIEPASDDSSVYATSGGRAHVAFSGILNAGIADALKQVMTIARTSAMVRLDLGKLVDADADGCTLMMRALGGLKKAKKEYIFGSPERLAELLAPKLEVGTRGCEAMWLLLLELYQQAFRQDLYEDVAVNYAVTFEVSPPSWEAPAAPKTPVESAPTSQPANNQKGDGFALRGQLIGAARGEFATLEAAVANRNEFVVDARNLVRIDAASAKVLLEIMTQMKHGGKKICIAGLSPLIAAYLESTGFADIAELRARPI